jgi:hypothetical protein
MVGTALKRAIPAPPIHRPAVPPAEVPVTPISSTLVDASELRLDELDEVVGGLERPFTFGHDASPDQTVSI